MTSEQTINQQDEIRVLDNAEVDCVAGGLMSIDISGMPDRAVGGCGTMWILNHLSTVYRFPH
jgi:hypothetical protein